MDAWGELPFQDVVEVCAEVLQHRPDTRIAFAGGAGASPLRGLRINGADPSQIEFPVDLPPVENHAVFSRIIGLSQR